MIETSFSSPLALNSALNGILGLRFITLFRKAPKSSEAHEPFPQSPMSIKELARSSTSLESIIGYQEEDTPNTNYTSIVFHFENSPAIAITVDQDTDELVWNETEADIGNLTLASTATEILKPKMELFLIWAWEMENHQGYFDALQLHFANSSLGGTIILQFVAAATMIKVFNVHPLHE